jgi:hypothetical protein
LLLLRPEKVLQPSWEEAALVFIRENHMRMRAASFARNGVWSRLRGARGEDGLLLSRGLYDALGGVRATDADENGLIRRVGRWRIAYLG